MLLDLNKLHGGHQHVERSFPSSSFETAPDQGLDQGLEYRVVSPIELSVEVEKSAAESFRVSGRVRGSLEMDCSRCIEPLAVPVDAAFDLRYVPQTANTGEGEREIAADDLDTAFYRDGALDLVELMREQFELALPLKPLCGDGCRGLCPHCGANRNRETCGCDAAWDDPRLAPLKRLLTREKET